MFTFKSLAQEFKYFCSDRKSRIPRFIAETVLDGNLKVLHIYTKIHGGKKDTWEKKIHRKKTDTKVNNDKAQVKGHKAQVKGFALASLNRNECWLLL